MNLNEQLATIQKNLVCAKNQYNSFGRYNYRSCEDILESVKPLLGGLSLIISDDVVEIGGRVYIKATVTLSDGDSIVTNTAFAREPELKKGQDVSQITGTSSSYARKYALNGLFLIDDTKDADTDEHSKTVKGENKSKAPAKKSAAPASKKEDTPKEPAKTGFRKKKAKNDDL